MTLYRHPQPRAAGVGEAARPDGGPHRARPRRGQRHPHGGGRRGGRGVPGQRGAARQQHRPGYPLPARVETRLPGDRAKQTTICGNIFNFHFPTRLCRFPDTTSPWLTCPPAESTPSWSARNHKHMETHPSAILHCVKQLLYSYPITNIEIL